MAVAISSGEGGSTDCPPRDGTPVHPEGSVASCRIIHRLYFARFSDNLPTLRPYRQLDEHSFRVTYYPWRHTPHQGPVFGFRVRERQGPRAIGSWSWDPGLQ